MRNYMYSITVKLANWIAVTFNLEVSIFDRIAASFEPEEM